MLPSSDGGYLFAGSIGDPGYAPDLAVRKLDSHGDAAAECLASTQLTLQVEPAAVTPVHLVCQEWPTSSVVLDSRAPPTEYGCFGLSDTLTTVNTVQGVLLSTDLNGCGTGELFYSVDFGDGTIISQGSSYHAFEHAGTYDAIMKVDAGTEKCTSVARFTVIEQPCVVSLLVQRATGRPRTSWGPVHRLGIGEPVPDPGLRTPGTLGTVGCPTKPILFIITRIPVTSTG